MLSSAYFCMLVYVKICHAFPAEGRRYSARLSQTSLKHFVYHNHFQAAFQAALASGWGSLLVVGAPCKPHSHPRQLHRPSLFPENWTLRWGSCCPKDVSLPSIKELLLGEQTDRASHGEGRDALSARGKPRRVRGFWGVLLWLLQGRARGWECNW